MRRPEGVASSVASCSSSDRDEDAIGLRGLRCDRKVDGQHPLLVARARGGRVDRLVELDTALKGAVLDLELLVAAADRRAATLAGNDEHAVGYDDLDLRRVDPRQLDHDVQRGRVLTAHAIRLRAEPAAPTREAWEVPEVVDELSDLAV
jgi:hypothetical protein